MRCVHHDLNSFTVPNDTTPLSRTRSVVGYLVGPVSNKSPDAHQAECHRQTSRKTECAARMRGQWTLQRTLAQYELKKKMWDKRMAERHEE